MIGENSHFLFIEKRAEMMMGQCVDSISMWRDLFSVLVWGKMNDELDPYVPIYKCDFCYLRRTEPKRKKKESKLEYILVEMIAKIRGNKSFLLYRKTGSRWWVTVWIKLPSVTCSFMWRDCYESTYNIHRRLCETWNTEKRCCLVSILSPIHRRCSNTLPHVWKQGVPWVIFIVIFWLVIAMMAVKIT